MKLRTYLDQTGETQMQFAQRSGVKQRTLSDILAGHDTGGRYWACIMRATDGMVTPLDHWSATRCRNYRPGQQPAQRRTSATRS